MPGNPVVNKLVSQHAAHGFDVKCPDSNIGTPAGRVPAACPMIVFFRCFFAVPLCCLFVEALAAPSSAGGGSASPAAPVVEPQLQLRMERKFLSIQPKGLTGDQDSAMPAFLVADQIEGRAESETIAEGSVEFRKRGSQLYADHVTYRPLIDEVEAKGNVRLLQYEDEMRGPYLQLKLSEQVGFFDEVDYRIKRERAGKVYGSTSVVTTTGPGMAFSNAPMMINVPMTYGLTATTPPRRVTEAQGHAKRIDFEGENQLRMRETTYSTCKPERQDWYMRAEEIHLDYDREVGELSNASIYFKEAPIFYLPMASFSLNSKRKSGFMTPWFSTSTKNGGDFTLPYYWNLAPNYDVTFFPRAIARRGFQLGTETRYLGHLYQGDGRFEYMPDDGLANRSRYAYNWNHTHNLGRGLTAAINWNGVSDASYWTDLSSRLLQTAQILLPRQLTLGYTPGSWWSASATWLRYQTLQPDPSIPVARPYFLEPQINVFGRIPNLSFADFSLVGQLSQFTHMTLPEGRRSVLYPQISFPIYHPAFNITPKIGVHATQYDLSRQVPGLPTRITRVLPTFTVDSTVVFEREIQWMGGDHIQTLEPRIYYVHIPYRDQSAIPIFDSGLSDFNFAQIFSENRYAGYDRINDANQITASVTSRFLDSNTGIERFRIMFGQRYYLRNPRVALPGETVLPRTYSSSLVAFNGLVWNKTYVDTALEYNHHKGSTDRFSIGGRYQPDEAKVLSASYRYVRSGIGAGMLPVSQVDIAGQWPLSSRWYAVGRYNFSTRDKKLLEAIGGLEYNSGCWSTRFVVQRLKAVSGTANTTFFVQLELNDFASIGSNPIQLLRRSIPGFGKVNQLPTSGSLLTSE
ncbi:MAG: LPS-assembly protein LptD precursor [Betaproteobacteria bacterium ADurb.Bin341]|nr:MAG: LPS-assembly protein LptD precursor [Betaproteobacteria bacterium ADurb.Bin341]